MPLCSLLVEGTPWDGSGAESRGVNHGAGLLKGSCVSLGRFGKAPKPQPQPWGWGMGRGIIFLILIPPNPPVPMQQPFNPRPQTRPFFLGGVQPGGTPLRTQHVPHNRDAPHRPGIFQKKNKKNKINTTQELGEMGKRRACPAPNGNTKPPRPQFPAPPHQDSAISPQPPGNEALGGVSHHFYKVQSTAATRGERAPAAEELRAPHGPRRGLLRLVQLCPPSRSRR